MNETSTRLAYNVLGDLIGWIEVRNGQVTLILAPVTGCNMRRVQVADVDEAKRRLRRLGAVSWE